MPSRSDVVIVGGGAAGLMCAITAAKRNRSVVLLERNKKVGEKIRISGGGRCNFTNLNVTSDNYISANPHFCKSALARFTPDDFVSLVEEHGIPYHEKTLGQLFCDGSAQGIIDMLVQECTAAGVTVLTGCNIAAVRKVDRFIVDTNQGAFESDSFVVASGGLSIPKLGATDFGYRLAKQFGVNITSTKAGLVPLTVNRTDLALFHALSGVSVDSVVTCNGTSFREQLLFTHRGLSGPSILQISSYWNPGDTLTINLSPEVPILEFLKEKHQSTTGLSSILSEFLPKSLAKQWCDRYASSRPILHFTFKELASVAEQLHNWKITPQHTEGYAKAEVTCGGVDTSELSSKTMESKRVPGLFLIGEVVDVTGHLGGYNFQWAWASGFVAGQYA